MTSVALISAFRMHTGTSNAMLDYYSAFLELGYDVKIYQLRSCNKAFEYPQQAIFIDGFSPDSRLCRFLFPFDLLFAMPHRIENLSEDIIILTDPVLLKLVKNFPNSIVIIYDLRDLTRYSKSLLRKVFYLYLFHFLKKSRDIIVVSDYTKELLIQKLRLKKEINVLNLCSRLNGKNLATIETRTQNLTRFKEFRILYVAADRPYKNIKLFVQVASLLQETHNGFRFKFILISKLRHSTKRLISKSNIKNIEIIEEIDDIAHIYSDTHLLLFPSLIEGFGLPIVEAMNFGIPIICSNLRPMSDIVGNSGIMLDPIRPLEWKESIIKLTEIEFYNKLSLASLERSKLFSYEIFKDELAKLMCKSMKKKGDQKEV
jgi:glycosyltransferase involved in cell wall biosynthesis